MITKEHGTIQPIDIYPPDPTGRGIHGIAGFVRVEAEVARLAIVQLASDRTRVIEQTGGENPGLYVADGFGGWLYLGGWGDVLGSYSLEQHASRHAPMGADPVGVTLFSASPSVLVRDLVYVSGSLTVARADNALAGHAPIIGAVVSKPTSILAVVAYFGVITGYASLLPGSHLFLGTNGGIIAPPLPTTAGTVIQKIGQAISATDLLLDPEQPIVL